MKQIIIDHNLDEQNRLSNFYTHYLKYNNNIFLSVEHAYNSSRLPYGEWYGLSARTTPKEYQQFGYMIDSFTCATWREKHKSYMMKILLVKYRIPEFAEYLLSTNDDYIIMHNYDKDNFWGYDINFDIGDNMLGKILMNMRTHIKSGGKLYNLYKTKFFN